MARPEDTLARGNTRNAAGYDQGYDNAQDPPRRDPRRPFDQRSREEPPPAARGQGPGMNPQFDPYQPPQNGPGGLRQAPLQARPTNPQDQARGAFRADSRDQRQDPPPPQGFASDPYSQPRTGRPNGAGQMPPPAGATSGRPGQTMRSQPPGYPQQANYAPAQGAPPRGAGPGYDQVPPTGRAREPFFEAPPSARQAPPPRYPAGVAQDGYGEDPYAETASGREADYDDNEAEDEEYEIEPAPRGKRGLILTLALVTAVAVGGGLGYVYKFSSGHKGTGAILPVVQADATPVKSVPVDAAANGANGGKKTILERAGATNDAAAVVPSQEQVAVGADPAAPDDTLAGPRKVATVVVKPGEKIAALGSVPAASDGQSADVIPGISLDGLDPAAKPIDVAKSKAKPVMKTVQANAAALAPPDQGMAADPAADGMAVPAADPAAKPVQLGKTAKKVKLAAVAPPAPAPDTAVADATDQIPVEPAAPAKVKTASVSPKPAGGSGYLIQVRSTKTQAEALAFFADLQQRYGDLLGASQPDIQQADLGAKGVWFRLRIGPPGSGAAAKDLCIKLKASGLKDCIVAPY